MVFNKTHFNLITFSMSTDCEKVTRIALTEIRTILFLLAHTRNGYYQDILNVEGTANGS